MQLFSQGEELIGVQDMSLESVYETSKRYGQPTHTIRSERRGRQGATIRVIVWHGGKVIGSARKFPTSTGTEAEAE